MTVHARSRIGQNRRPDNTFRTFRQRWGARCGPRAARAGAAPRSARHARPSRHGGPAAAAGRGPGRPFPGDSRRPFEDRARIARDPRALHASGRDVRPRAGAAQCRGRDADRVGKDALLQRARSCIRCCRITRAARCICFRPRRWRRISSPSCRDSVRRWRHSATKRLASSPTTAIRRRMRGAAFERAPIWCSAIPTWCIRAFCRTIRGGRSCSRISNTSSSTSCTPIAGCSAAICATSCAVCSGSAGTTAPIRSSSVHRRPSPTRASWPSA